MTDKLKNNTETLPYFSKDLAIIIPTKDRPKEVRRLLKSITELDCKVGRIIVIASGQDIQDVVMTFVDQIPVEYYSSQPGQIKQRNKGIALLDESTKLVATKDDDAVFHKTAISEMIKFWNSIEADTAGVGFNIVNQPGHSHTWLKGVFGVSVPEPGKVLKSGFSTAITNVKQNIRSEWLNGGATVWRQDILKNHPHHEINSQWASFEDLIFSYPIGKKYPLYISKNAQIKIDSIYSCTLNAKTLIYRGKTNFIWGTYFVTKNSDMSIFGYIYYKLLQLIITLIKGVNNKHKLFEGIGIIHGFVLVLPALIANKNFTEIIEDNT